MMTRYVQGNCVHRCGPQTDHENSMTGANYIVYVMNVYVLGSETPTPAVITGLDEWVRNPAQDSQNKQVRVRVLRF